MKIKVGISNHHVHLSREALEILFGKGYELTVKNELLQKEVILYGDIPAIAYIFDLKPAVYTTWADLNSNSLEQLETELV